MCDTKSTDSDTVQRGASEKRTGIDVRLGCAWDERATPPAATTPWQTDRRLPARLLVVWLPDGEAVCCVLLPWQVDD